MRFAASDNYRPGVKSGDTIPIPAHSLVFYLPFSVSKCDQAWSPEFLQNFRCHVDGLSVHVFAFPLSLLHVSEQLRNLSTCLLLFQTRGSLHKGIIITGYMSVFQPRVSSSSFVPLPSCAC